jgi:hypothetical protein
VSFLTSALISATFEAYSLHANCDRARGDLDLLQDEGSRLKVALHGVKSRSELAEPSLWEVEFTWCR